MRRCMALVTGFAMLTQTVMSATLSAHAGGIHRGPAVRDSTWTPSPVVITPADRVRIEMVSDPARVPASLRGQFVASLAGISATSVTVALEGGKPAVIHRDMINKFAVGIDHGSRTKHTLVGGLIAGVIGAALGLAGSGSSGWMSGPELVPLGAVLFAPIGLLVGFVLPAGEDWKTVPLDRVQWAPSADVSLHTPPTSRASSPSP